LHLAPVKFSPSWALLFKVLNTSQISAYDLSDVSITTLLSYLPFDVMQKIQGWQVTAPRFGSQLAEFVQPPQNASYSRRMALLQSLLKLITGQHRGTPK
jgi:hypothetical protein